MKTSTESPTSHT